MSTRTIILTAVCALMAIGMALSGCSGSDSVIARNGTSKYAVVIPDDAIPAERHAADEIVEHVKLATDAVIPVVKESDPRAQEPNRIFVGNSEQSCKIILADVPVDFDSLGEEEYILRTVSGLGSDLDILIIGGRPRGVLYGAYALLDHMGFRWFTPTVTRYPVNGELRIASIRERKSPYFMYRVPWITEAYDPDWAARNIVHSGHSDDPKYGGMVGIQGAHTFDMLMPPSLYSEHPEYFPLIGGKRVTGYVQRCLSNDNLAELCAQNMIAWMDSLPDQRFFSLGQNDVEKLCECPECSRIIEEQGAPSGLFVHFANKVAEKVMKVHPENYITIFAYTFSEKPPKTIRPHDHVIIRMAPIRQCFGHPFTECTSPQAAAFRENLEGWAKLTNQIFVWHYVTDFPNYLMPYPDFNEITADVKNYHERGVNGIYFQGAYTSKATADAELRSWVIARMFQDPDRDGDAVINDWMQGVYGQAWEAMREAFDLTQTYTESPDNHLFIYDPPTREMWPEHTIASIDSLHDVAERQAANDPVALNQIRKNRLTVDYLKLILNTGVLKVVDGMYQPVGCTVTPEDFDRFIERTREFDMTALREEGMDGSFYIQFRQRMETHPVVSIENDALKITAVPDIGGRVVEIIDKATGENIVHTGDTYYNYYPAYGGYEEVTAWGWDCSGFANKFDAKVNGRSMTLTTKNPEGLVFSKTFTLAPSGAEFTIKSSIANDSDHPQTYRLVCRMCLETPPDIGKLTARMPDGTFAKPTATEELDFFWPYHLTEYRYDGENKPAGAWRLEHADGRWVIENRFDESVVETCIWHNPDAKNMVRLDLHTADKEVSPGNRIGFTHNWKLIKQQK